MKFKNIPLLASVLTSLSMCLSSFAAPYVCADEAESETPVFSDDFEGETISGWGVFGGSGELVLDTDNKKSGNASLNISGREKSYNSPSITLDSYVTKLETYKLTGWIYHEGSQTESLTVTVKFTDSVNNDNYSGAAQIEAEPETWTYFEGTVTVPEDTKSTFMYIEAQNSALIYNIDDIRIYGKAPQTEEKPKFAPKDGSVSSFHFDFESGFDNCNSRGDMRLIRTDEHSFSGDYSVLATNRTKIWNGPIIPIDTIARGAEYTYSANVLYTDQKADPSHSFRLELQYNYGGSEVYELIASAEAARNEWTNISGVFTIPEGATNVFLYMQTANLEEGVTELSYTDLVSFYADDISIIRSDLASTKSLALPMILAISLGVAALIFMFIVMKSRFNKKPVSEGNEASEASLENLTKEYSAPGKTDSSDNKATKKPENKNSSSSEENKPEKKASEARPDAASAKTTGTKAPEKSEKPENNKSDQENKNTQNSGTGKKKKKNSGNNQKPDSAKHSSGSKQDSSETTREQDIFNIETFSYEDENANYETDSEDNPLDAPFDGF